MVRCSTLLGVAVVRIPTPFSAWPRCVFLRPSRCGRGAYSYALLGVAAVRIPTPFLAWPRCVFLHPSRHGRGAYSYALLGMAAVRIPTSFSAWPRCVFLHPSWHGRGVYSFTLLGVAVVRIPPPFSPWQRCVFQHSSPHGGSAYSYNLLGHTKVLHIPLPSAGTDSCVGFHGSIRLILSQTLKCFYYIVRCFATPAVSSRLVDGAKQNHILVSVFMSFKNKFGRTYPSFFINSNILLKSRSWVGFFHESFYYCQIHVTVSSDFLSYNYSSILRTKTISKSNIKLAQTLFLRLSPHMSIIYYLI